MTSVEEDVLLARARSRRRPRRAPSKRSQLSRSAADRRPPTASLRRAARGVALEQRPQLIEVVEILGRVRADGGAAVRRRVDQALGLEHEQRLAHGRAADAELARELLLLQRDPPAAAARRRSPAGSPRSPRRSRSSSAAHRSCRISRHASEHTVCNPFEPSTTRQPSVAATAAPASASAAVASQNTSHPRARAHRVPESQGPRDRRPPSPRPRPTGPASSGGARSPALT